MLYQTTFNEVVFLGQCSKLVVSQISGGIIPKSKRINYPFHITHPHTRYGNQMNMNQILIFI